MKAPFLIGTLIVCAVACSKNDDNNNLNETDNYFMQQASYSNNAEVAAGQIAVTNGSYDSVKMFGNMMVDDHSKSQNSLDSLGNSFGVALPTTADSVHEAKAAMLQSMSGYMFDTAYINAQVKDHEATIALFQQELASGNNQQVKNYATTYLPVIEMHYQEAQTIQASLR